MQRSRVNGWAIFAATMLFVVGAVNIVQGVVAMFTPEYFVAAEGEILVFGYTTWGLILGIWGIVLVLAGAAMLSGRMWARALTVVLAALNAFAQLAFIDSYPVWSLVVIAIDVLLVYGVTAGWRHGRVQEATGGADAYAAGRADARSAAADREAAGEGESAGEGVGRGREQAEEAGGGGTRERAPEAGERERTYGGASTQQARQAAMERPPGTRPGKHEHPTS
ncbi:DUF7144 family membrane protein [Streptomonospora litoralis]|uniref:DUF7144 domain-containing protein n=1 Tax=Streptomonospora litoralis TaxID=2498135 RepID=A0A4P6Q757_9ACTN|nr:hypothetical protein [Streptomonospora litoralis]QBI54764.1 hypothetical protein EKD16_14930 [Streptomonospora litoralis]